MKNLKAGDTVYLIVISCRRRFCPMKTYIDKVIDTPAGISYHTHDGEYMMKYDGILYTDEAEARAVAEYANTPDEVARYIKNNPENAKFLCLVEV